MAEREWTAAMLHKAPEKAIAMCTEDVVYMPSDSAALYGHAALRGWLQQFPTLRRFTQPVEEIEGYGELAICRCTFSATLDVGGREVANSGKVLVWLRKQEPGSWLVKAVCWNWDRPQS